MTHRCSCGRPAPDTTICAGCTRRLRNILARVPTWRAELNAAHLAGRGTNNRRQDRHSKTTPLPHRPDITALIDQIDHDIRWWTRWIAHRYHVLLPDTDPAIWLAQRCYWIAKDHDADALLDVLERHNKRVHRLIDLPIDRARVPIPAPCPDCGGFIAGTVRDDEPLRLDCGGCGKTWRAHQVMRLSHQIAAAI